MTLLHPTMALLGSTSLYYTLYLGSTWLYLTLLHSTMALLSSAGLYLTLLYTLPWLYVALLDSVQGRIQVGGGQGGPMPPMPPLSGLSRRKQTGRNRKFSRPYYQVLEIHQITSTPRRLNSPPTGKGISGGLTFLPVP